MERVPIHRISVRLPEELEELYQEDSFYKSLRQLRINIIVVAVIYSLFGVLDALVTPEVKLQAWFIRYAIVLPTVLFVLAFSYAPQFKQYQQLAVSFLVLVGGGGIVGLITLTHVSAPYMHFAGLLLVFMTSYTAFRLRFLYATFVGWTIIGMYEVSAIRLAPPALPVFLTDNFFYISANLMGMFINYQRELYLRKEFFQNRQMQILEKERHLLETAHMHATMEQAISSLRESEEKFRTLAETATMGIFIHQGGNFLYANRASEIIGGYSIAEYLTMNFLSLVHPDYLDLVKSRAKERLAGSGEVPTQYEFKVVKKNGEARWVLMTAGISEFGGKPAVIGTIVDIHDRKQAEEERDQMALLVENSSDFIGMATMDGQVIFVNSAGRRLAGLDSADDVKKMNLAAFFLDEDVPALAQQLLPNDSWRGEFRLRHVKTRQAIPVDMYGFTIFDEKSGKPLARAAVIRDITDLKKAREEREHYYQQLQQALLSLKASEARFRTLAETTSAGIIIHRGGKFLYTNPAIQEITGYSRDELSQLEFWKLIHAEDRDMVRDRGLARMQGEEVPNDYEFRIISKNGTVQWANNTAAIIEFEGKPAVIATLFDITDRKRAEAEKAKLFEERIEEERRHLMEKEKILMDLHDGIGGITTNISILSELGQKAEGIEGVKNTLATISRLSKEGIAEIRSFMQSLDSKELSWRTLTAELRNQGTTMLELHGISCSLDASIPDALEQPGSLLWINLIKIYKEALTNVIKHSKARSVAVRLTIDDKQLELTVQDDGVGCAGDQGARGRGLSNMQKRGEEIGGRLVINSSNGTRVNFTLPLPLKYPIQGME